ncbi:MAG TPA: tetratricopeptide repeat protein [Candidatus Polarisedimenticolia bacterium]|nr:tetratricopeptide repeat protein [Candidatus Polarisedimenticolia bacterium]
MRKPVGIVLSLLFLAVSALDAPLQAQQQTGPSRVSRLLLIIPFENTSNAAATDWISESFPEVLSTRLSLSGFFIMGRDDRLNAFDRLGIPSGAKPSRATLYQAGQQLDADYVIMGDYRVDEANVTAHARLMDMERLRLSLDFTESGPLTNLIVIQTALAWDILNMLKPSTIAKDSFIAHFPAQRPDVLENYVRGITAANDQEKIKYFKEVVRLEPTHGLAILQMGKSYYKTRDYESAASWLARIPKGDPNANEAQFYLGLAAFYGGHMDKADSAFRTLAARLPLTEVLNNLGVIAARRGQKGARGYFEKTVQTDPNEPDYRFNLAVTLFREGDTQGAARELRELLAIHPDAEAKTFLDAVASGTQPARMPLERIKRNYDESTFRQIALEIENTNEARLAKSDPASHAAFHVRHGQELLQSGLPGEAEKEFREAVVLDPTSPGAHAGLAVVLENDQDMVGARNEARMSLKLQPTAEAYLVMARLDLAENKSASAAQNVDHALALDPANAAAVALKRDIASGTADKAASQHP